MSERSTRLSWGNATALLHRSRHIGWVDLLVVASLLGLIYGVIGLAHRWTGVLRPTVEIDLSPLALPRYTLYSLARGLLAYLLSFIFTLVYGYWAAKDQRAGRILVPILDILQSVPVLGFMPGLIMALVALFPTTNIGLELAAIIMIFTGQAWNMTFSFYYSLRSVPADQSEVATLYRFNWRQRLRYLELPYAAMGLVWNSMMSMAGGWFFLMINEAFVLGDHDFRLPGIGSYMSLAVAKGDATAMVLAVLAMVLMIVLLDQLLWRPVVAWAQKFRIEEGTNEQVAKSWFLDLSRRSQILKWCGVAFSGLTRGVARRSRVEPAEPVLVQPKAPKSRYVSAIAVSALALLALVGSVKLLFLVQKVSLQDWWIVLLSAATTLLRVMIAVALGTLWALPVGLAIGLSPKLSRFLQPVVQVAASFPAPMLFPAVIALLAVLHVGLGIGSIALLLLGTQWYVLFNVVAGAMAIPTDLREAAKSYGIPRLQRFVKLYIPATFPYLVTGWVTAAGGGWNASIVAEYVTFRGKVVATTGLGALISQTAAAANFPLLAASVAVMAIIVVTFNQSVWRRLYRLARDRYSLNR